MMPTITAAVRRPTTRGASVELADTAQDSRASRGTPAGMRRRNRGPRRPAARLTLPALQPARNGSPNGRRNDDQHRRAQRDIQSSGTSHGRAPPACLADASRPIANSVRDSVVVDPITQANHDARMPISNTIESAVGAVPAESGRLSTIGTEPVPAPTVPRICMAAANVYSTPSASGRPP